MDSNQSEQSYYLSKLTSNIISPAQYPCTMIGSNKSNIHTIVPNSNNNSLNINVKYQNSNESKLAQSVSYKCYSNIANSSFNQNDDIKFLFSGTKPKKIPHTKRLKGAINQCIDNSNDITAAPNQLTILVQKVLPAQVPDNHPPLSTAAHISTAQSIHSVISQPPDPIISPPIGIIPHVTIDTIATVINDVISKATSNDPHDDVFLSVLKSRCDLSFPDNQHSTFIPPNTITPQFVNVNSDSNHKRLSNISLESSSNINKRSPNKRPRLTESSYNDNKSYQRCQLSAPNFRKLVHEPRISDKCLLLQPVGVTSRRWPCINLDQLKHYCVKYKRVPFLLSQPHPRTIYQDKYIVENLNANIPSSTLITSHDIVDDIYCIVAPSPNNNDLDYLSVFSSDQISSPSINLSGPNLEMLHPQQRTLSPQLSLFHCPNKGYLRLDHSLSQSSNISHKYVSTPTSDPLSDTSIVDSETGEMVTSAMKPHQKLQLLTQFTSNQLNSDDFSIVDDDATQLRSSDYCEMPLYSEKVYKSTSLQWKRKLRENNISEDCTSINEDDAGSQSKDPDGFFIGEELSSVIQVQGSVSSKSKDQHIFIGEDSPDSSMVIQVQGSLSSKSKQISKRLNIILNDKISKKKLVSTKSSAKLFKNVKYYNFHPQSLAHSHNSVISESQFVQLSRQMNTIRTLPQPVPDTRQCSFCHQRGDLPESSAGRLLNVDKDRWSHVNCALWCDEVIETQSGALTDLPKSITAICTTCGKSGAGVACSYGRCTAKYHVSCARDSNCHFQNDKAVYCSQHQSSDVTLRSLSVKRRVYISRDECSQIVAAVNDDCQARIRTGALSLISLGTLLPCHIHSEHFHNLNHVYPVGFKSQRIYWSSRLINRRSLYLSEIILDNDRPLFKVTAIDTNFDDVVYQSRDCNSVWKEVLTKIVNLRSKHNLVKCFPEIIKGEYLFGLTEPNIIRLIESLPGFEHVCDFTYRRCKPQVMENTPSSFNVSGSSRSEPFQRAVNENHKLFIHQSPSFIRYNLILSQKQERSSMVTVMNSNKWQQYRRLKQEWKRNVALKMSSIQGLGLHAAKDLEKGTMIIEYVGELIRNEVASKRGKQYDKKKKSTYMFRLDDSTVIDATMSGHIARYINHSCEPNCLTEVIECEKGSHVVIISKKKIEKNEELTYDYRFQFEDDSKVRKIPCLCGARSCRRWVN